MSLASGLRGFRLSPARERIFRGPTTIRWMIGPLLFRPLYQPRMWGGRSVTAAFGRELPADQKIGESWEVVDRADQQSVVSRGPLAGASLRDLMATRPDAIMGRSWDRRRPFPILVKWLDCRERLSLQVHPPAAIAAALGGEPKTENWYIAGADPGASLIVGLRRGVTREEFERGLAAGTLETLVHRFPVRAGDSMFVRSGRIHAIDAGNLILEIQQNSDTTYRVYDWGRVADDGRPRALHIVESLRCIDFNDFEPTVTRPAPDGDIVLAQSDEFRIRRLRRAAGGTFQSEPVPREPCLVSVVAGSVAIETQERTERCLAGDNVMLPADTAFALRAESESTMLITDGFSRGD
jgi:mannose-6-phosphate isomerase